MSDNQKTQKLGKILKIVGEFIVAIITAIFASSYALPLFQ